MFAKKLSACLFLLLIVTGNLKAQYTGTVWCFGDSAGIDFNSTSPSVVSSTEKAIGSTVTICDSIGNLILYSYPYYHAVAGNVTLVINKYGNTMQNGSGIVGVGWYHELVLLPDPGNDSLVYLFSIGVTGSTMYGLYYSIINYKLNNDSGVVIQKNIQLRNDPAFDGLTTIKHGNGKDWWLLFRRYDPNNISHGNDFYFYFINKDSITTLPDQNIGSIHRSGGGDIAFNTTGTRFAYVDWSGIICLYDFDRCTGTISNPVNIEYDRQISPFPYYMSCEFSQNSNYLYVTSYQNVNDDLSLLYQYDLTATDIAASRQVIYQFPDSGMAVGQLKKSPVDDKIYVSCGYETWYAGYPYNDTIHNAATDYLSVINQPDSLGAACDFQPFSFYLGGRRTYYGLPNNPDYTLGPLVGSPCDTITAVHDIAQPKTNEQLKIFYHSQWDIAFINADKLSGRKYTFTVFDITGKEIYTEKGNLQPPYFTKDFGMQSFSKGIYIVILQTDKESVNGRFVKY